MSVHRVLEINKKLAEANGEISTQSEIIANYNAQLEAMPWWKKERKIFYSLVKNCLSTHLKSGDPWPGYLG